VFAKDAVTGTFNENEDVVANDAEVLFKAYDADTAYDADIDEV
jgi:hypothetical protein